MIARCSSQLKRSPGGKIAGFDIATLLSVTEALGYDRQAVLRLLDHAEAGLFEAIRDHGQRNPEHFDPDRGH